MPGLTGGTAANECAHLGWAQSSCFPFEIENTKLKRLHMLYVGSSVEIMHTSESTTSHLDILPIATVTCSALQAVQIVLVKRASGSKGCHRKAKLRGCGDGKILCDL